MAVHFDIDHQGLHESWFKHYPPTGTWSAHGVRPEEILKRLPEDRPIRGVELGVHRGWLAAILLEERPLLELTMVDIWENSEHMEEAVRATDFAKERRRIVHMSSEEAAQWMVYETFDFIFIDADHEYEAVKQDIALWRPMCKLVCGHDYKAVTFGHVRMFNGVAWAVHDAFKEVELGGDQTWFALR